MERYDWLTDVNLNDALGEERCYARVANQPFSVLKHNDRSHCGANLAWREWLVPYIEELSEREGSFRWSLNVNGPIGNVCMEPIEAVVQPYVVELPCRILLQESRLRNADPRRQTQQLTFDVHVYQDVNVILHRLVR